MSASFAPDCWNRPPYRELHPSFRSAVTQLTSFPAPAAYDELARSVPCAADVELPRFVTESREALRRVGGYEQHVAELGLVPTRPGSWHDFFNMTVWAHFPKSRWALNALHVDREAGPKDPRNGRAPAQNLAASFDEVGMVVLSESHSLLEELRALRFKHVFWDRRAELLATTRFWLLGHGMLESLLTPHPALAARSLLLHVPALGERADDDQLRFEIDARSAEQIRSWRQTRVVLDPIPLMAIPGYCANDSAAFYEDSRNIRFEPISRRPVVVG